MPIYLTTPYSYIILGLLFCLLLLSRYLFKPTKLKGKYSPKTNLLSPSELEAYKVLKNTLPQGYVVFPQVNLDKIFDINDANRSYTPRNKIDRKSVDFVVFEEQNLKPALAIELDDPSHLRYDRQQRDFFVNQLFIDTQLKLLRINTGDVRNIDLLKQKLNSNLIQGITSL